MCAFKEKDNSPFRTDLPLISEVRPVLADDGEARPIGHIEARRADDGVDLALDAVGAHDAVLGDALHGREVHVDVLLLDRHHVGVAGRDAAAANAPRRREALEQALVFDELGHAGAEELLAFFLGFAVLVEGAPEAVDLVFDRLGVFHELGRVAVGGLLLGRVFVVAAEVVGDLNEPDRGADEDLGGGRVRGLDRRERRVW